MDDDKEMLHGYLRVRRADLLAKLDGLGEYDIRRPMTPSGTSLLGLVKHVASTQLGYFGEVFGRPAETLPSLRDGLDDDADMWALGTETRAEIVQFHHTSAAHADATIAALEWDAPGEVPWWPDERRAVTLQQVIVHMAVETARHAGHADILRESLDGALGNGPTDPNVPDRTSADWSSYTARVDAAARAAASAAGELTPRGS